MASQFTLTPEKKRRIAESQRKKVEAEAEYDPKAPEAPNRAVPVKPLGTLSKPNIADDTIRERVASIPRNIAIDLGANATYANRLGEDAAAFADYVPLLGDTIGAEETKEAIKSGDWKTAALTGAGTLAGVVPGAGKIVGKGIKGLAKKGGREALAEAKAGIRAYHGSPHSFDQFDISKIGTGEGEQAYGHGLYFAENEGVARSYRDNLARPDFNATSSGAPISSDLSRILEDSYDDAMRQGVSAPTHRDAIHLAQQNLDRQRADALKAGDFDWFNKVSDQINELQRMGKDAPATKGSMYEVNINADPSHFLDWDKPLSEQPQKIRDIYAGTTGHPDPATLEGRLKAINLEMDAMATNRDPVTNVMRDEKRWHELAREREKLHPMWKAGQSGSNIYNTIVDQTDKARRGSMPYKQRAEAGSEQLRAAGIPGIKYLDAGSRSAGDGSRNYVVFDPKIIEIVKKYGIAGALGAGLISEEMARQMQKQQGGSGGRT